MNISVQVFVWVDLFHYLRYIPRRRIAELSSHSVFDILRNWDFFFKAAAPFLIPTRKIEQFRCLCCLFQHLLFPFFCFCELISHSFDLHFPNDWWCEHPSMCLVSTCISSLEKFLVRFFAHLLIGLFVFYCWVVAAFYIFWILCLC